MADDDNQNIEFVLEVEKYPCLYNNTLPSYSRRTETDKAWAEIGKTMKMTGAACKDKWRNLRVVFMRHLKPLPSGSGRKKKKPYYLLDYMQFLTPYVKPVNPPEAGNLPSTSTDNTETINRNLPSTSTDNTETINTNDGSNDVPDNVPTETESEPDPNRPRPTDPPIPNDNPTQQSSNPKRKKSSLHETDKHFINYLKQKSANLTNSPSTDPVMPFLNSLAPELREMNLQQFKIFKRRVLSLIDDILNPSSASSTTPESAASQFITLSNETSRQTIYSPISQYTEYGSPSYAQPVPTPNPLDFSRVSTGTPLNSMEPVPTPNPVDFSGVSTQFPSNSDTGDTPVNQAMFENFF